MSDKVFIEEPDPLHNESYGTLSYLMPSEMHITQVSDTLKSDFERIGIVERRKKSEPIRRAEYTYNELTTDQMILIRKFFEDPEIEWEKGSFWLPVLDTDYKLIIDDRHIGNQVVDDIHIYILKTEGAAPFAVNDIVFVMNHHRNYDIREIINISQSGIPAPYDVYWGIQFFDRAYRDQDTEPLPWGKRLNYEVLGKQFNEDWNGFFTTYPPWSATYIDEPEPPWGGRPYFYQYSLEWFHLNLYERMKVRLIDSAEFKETVSALDFNLDHRYSITIKFEEDLMEAE